MRPTLVLMSSRNDAKRSTPEALELLPGPPENNTSPPARAISRSSVNSCSALVAKSLTAWKRPPTAGIHAVGNGKVLVDRSECAGHVSAVGNRVEQDARGGEANGAASDRLLDDSTHTVEFGRGGSLIAEGALAHHVVAHGAVTDEADHVERGTHLLHRVEVFRVRVPAPSESTEDRVTGNVFNALHHLGQERAVVRCDGGEGNAAVAHEDGGHAVP